MSVLIYDNQNKKDLSSIITMIHCLFNCDAWNEHFHNLSLNDFDIFKDIFQLYSKYISNKNNNSINITHLLEKLKQNGCNTSSPIDFLMFLLNFIYAIKDEDFKGWFSTKYRKKKQCFMCEMVYYDSNNDDDNINMIDINVANLFTFLTTMEDNPLTHKSKLMKLYKEYLSQNALECNQCEGNYCVEMKESIDNNISKYLLFNLNCDGIDLNDGNNKNMIAEMLNDVVSGSDVFDNDKFETEVKNYFYRINTIILKNCDSSNQEKYTCIICDLVNNNYVYFNNKTKIPFNSFDEVKQLISNVNNLCGAILIYQNVLVGEKLNINNSNANNIQNSNKNKDNNNKEVNKSNINIQDNININKNVLSNRNPSPQKKLCELCFNPLELKQQICSECRAFNS